MTFNMLVEVSFFNVSLRCVYTIWYLILH